MPQAGALPDHAPADGLQDGGVDGARASVATRPAAVTDSGAWGPFERLGRIRGGECRHRRASTASTRHTSRSAHVAGDVVPTQSRHTRRELGRASR
jgi:hypothetical protein